MKPTHIITLAAMLLAPALSHADFMAVSLPGTLTDQGLWNGFDTETTMPGPFVPTGDSSAVFNRTEGTASVYPADGQSTVDYIYTLFSSPNTFTVTDSEILDGLSNVVFQVESGGATATEVELTYTLEGDATSYVMATAYTATADGQNGTINAYQWDLSSVASTLESYTITLTNGVHSALFGMQLNTSNAYAGNAIPEPSTYAALAGLGVLTVVLLRRRKLSQK
ncbi:MAG: PEP-CTERM sorting domain-containing protein [Puniceicoccales bacterium]